MCVAHHSSVFIIINIELIDEVFPSRDIQLLGV